MQEPLLLNAVRRTEMYAQLPNNMPTNVHAAHPCRHPFLLLSTHDCACLGSASLRPNCHTAYHKPGRSGLLRGGPGLGSC